jgi:catechol 2,3-dioxygenase
VTSATARYVPHTMDAPRDPEELEASSAPVSAELPAGTAMGAVHLTVADIERSLAYYRGAVGLELLGREDGRASLGAGGRDLLALVEEPDARPAAGYTGLYHFALLVPERTHLAGWLAHAARDRVPLVGLSDHFVSEALYLSDPDQHGIEIYWDRPRERWEGQVAARMTTLPLDVHDLLEELDDPAGEAFDGLPTGTIMGHVHLKVAAVPEAVRFYRDGVGFSVMATLGRQAVFLGAGGYHHHIAANVWESAGAGAPPAGSAALRLATIMVPDAGERERALARLAALGHQHRDDSTDPIVVDPSGNPLVLTVDPRGPTSTEELP